MGVSNLQNLPPGDVLEKLKMQVGLIDPEFAMNSLRNLNPSANSPYGMQHGNEPPSTQHAASLQVTAASAQQPGFQFTTPNAPNTKEGEHRADLHFYIIFISTGNPLVNALTHLLINIQSHL